MNFDRKYLVWALGYLAAGMCLGIYMATSQNHVQHATHAHINLVGFLLSFGYGIIHKLWLGQHSPGTAKVQFIVHQTGAVIMISGLFLLFGNFVAEPTIGPVLGLASITVLVGALLMLYMVLNTTRVKT